MHKIEFYFYMEQKFVPNKIGALFVFLIHWVSLTTNLGCRSLDVDVKHVVYVSVCVCVLGTWVFSIYFHFRKLWIKTPFDYEFPMPKMS